MEILSSNDTYHTIRLLIDGTQHDLTVVSEREGGDLVLFLTDYATAYEKDLRTLWAALAEEAVTPNV